MKIDKSAIYDSLPIIGMNNNKEITFNDKSYNDLKEKRAKINSKFSKNNEDNDLLSYYISKPIKLVKNPNMKFKINKDDLNQFFLELKEKRKEKEIYNSDLFKLFNLYHLIEEKKYLNKNFIPENILINLEEEKESLIEREFNKFSNKFYDTEKRILFELSGKENSNNKIKNYKIIKESIKQKCFIVRLKNNNDNFNQILLLKPDYHLDELQVLIKFLYKTKYGQNDIKMINFYYQDDYKNELNIEEIKTMDDLSKKINSKIELTIYIDAQY